MKMLELHSTVVYGSSGIYRVTEIREEISRGKKNCFYVLQSVSDEKSFVYLPTDNPVLLGKVRQVLDRDAVCALIDSFPDLSTEWIVDDRHRADHFRFILDSGDRLKIAELICTIYVHKQELMAKGRRLRSSDDGYFQRAERLLYDEFALALGLERSAVVPFIAARLNPAS